MTSSMGEHLCRRFSLAEMQLATGDFGDEQVIGRGGFGAVYRGRIDNGSSIVAVKRLAPNSNQGRREFVTEMETLSMLRHNNLVSLIGCCNEQGEMILVYEYISNGTLANHLHGNNHDRNSSLTWNQRLKICIGAARGLDYLHTGRSVIHRDVKPTNILLDENFTAKVSDFGLAKNLNLEESHVSTIVKGSFGYFDPFYFISRRLTKASDTYAFGVVLLEVLSGRPAIDGNLSESELCLTMWAQEKIKNKKFHEIVDSSVRAEILEDCLKTYVGVIKSCLDHEPAKRMSMTKALAQLELALEQQERKEPVRKLQFGPLKAFWNRVVPSGKTKGKEMLVPQPGLFEGPCPVVEDPQPLVEVAPADSDNGESVENQTTNEPQTSRFTWTIDNFSRLNMKKQYSDVFTVGGYKWHVLIYPKGNNVDDLSIYLDVADSATLPNGWSIYAEFSLAIVNQLHNNLTVKKDTEYQLNQRESGWGFTSFMPLSELYDPNRGFLVNDTCVVEAEIDFRHIIESRKGTGYVGLKNQGATAYINSLLQTLYHIPYFRKAIYHMPATEIDNPTGGIPLALQSLFYKLQYNDTSVATKELTKSFGWNTSDLFIQHDVLELYRVLSEKLRDKMKGTVVEGTIQRLFEGHHMKRIYEDLKSTIKESFYDIQLDVKGCKDVYASFDKYAEVERLVGDNKYHAKEHGLQDSKKGVLYVDFPPVLLIQLKRYEYDSTRDTMVKVNDRYEFPLELDLDRENGKYLSPEADRSVRNLYMLHSVLVHSGGVHGGHYHAFIRPTLTDQWYKFDDEMVTEEDVKRAVEEQYGGYNDSNAYILVYIRVSDKDKIICHVDENDIAEHLRIRMKKVLEEKEDKRRYKAEARHYAIIKVARDEDLREQIGKDIYFDLVDHDKIRNFRFKKRMPFNLFKEEVDKEFGIPFQLQRFWIWGKRQNHTYRPQRLLTPREESQKVGAFWEVSNTAELKLFLEVERGPDLQPIPLPEMNKDDILLFFKLYDPLKEELRYVGRLYVKSYGKPVEILTKLNELAGFAPDEEIDLFEEIKFEPSVMCERLDREASFQFSQISDGDIICFQKRPSPDSEEQVRFPDVPSFLEYVKNRQIVHFRALERPEEDEFCLELAKKYTYDDVVGRVAQHLALDDPSKIRLTPHNCYSQQPKLNPIKYRSVDHLIDMLVHGSQISDILYYEVLEIPLPELQCLKSLKVVFHHATRYETTILNITLPNTSTVGDALDEIKSKVELSNPNAELRLLEIFHHKIYKIFPTDENIEDINDQYWTLRAEEIHEDEKDPGPNDRLVHVYHFRKETAQHKLQVENFGEPFILLIHEGETLEEVKARLQKKLRVPEWKFAIVSQGRPEYLGGSDIVSTHFLRRDVYGGWEQYFGLEH